MNWYAAHIITYIQFSDGTQDKYPVLENIVLVQAASIDAAWAEAERLGKEEYNNPDSEVYWENRPGRRIFEGVRKIIECRDLPTRAVERGENVFHPGSGTEITYSELELETSEDLAKLVEGEAVTIRYEE